MVFDYAAVSLRPATARNFRQIGKEFSSIVEKETIRRAIAFFDDFNIEGTQAGTLTCGRLLIKSGRLCVVVGKIKEEDEVWLFDEGDEQMWDSGNGTGNKVIR